ncbi:MAG TPA: aquaporin [Fimbriimonadaceae bacterium]|jgi:aquaporin Z
MLSKLLKNWPEYLMEGGLLGIFMLSACFFTALLVYPGSPVASALPGALPRRVFIGLAMGLTAVFLIYSPWGQRSGAHMNPAVTLTFLRLGKVAKWDALFYILAQFIGGALAVLLASIAFRAVLSDPAVSYATTTPGPYGVAVAFVAELGITFILMLVILLVSNIERAAHFTGLFAGLLIMVYVSFEAPLSGMSMNPARTLASAVAALDWTAIWIYFVAPPMGMFLAAEVYLLVRGKEKIFCAKLHHSKHHRCIFCEHRQAQP